MVTHRSNNVKFKPYKKKFGLKNKQITKFLSLIFPVEGNEEKSKDSSFENSIYKELLKLDIYEEKDIDFLLNQLS